MIFLIDESGVFHENVTGLFGSIEEAIASYGEFIAPFKLIEYDGAENPTYGWRYLDGVWYKPEQNGSEYDVKDGCFYPHDEYRRILHERTSNDTLQAMRKIREGDKSYDWQAWLNKLDDYNLAIEKTQDQETYPNKVTYPEYPSR